MNYGELPDLVKYLQKKMKSKKKSGSKTKDDNFDCSDDRSDATVINLLTMFPKILKENQKKVVKFCEKKIGSV